MEELGQLTEEVSDKRKIAKHLLFENFEKDVQEMEDFVRKQQDGIKIMVDESNNLREYNQVLKKACQMIYGSDAKPQPRLSDSPAQMSNDSDSDLMPQNRLSLHQSSLIQLDKSSQGVSIGYLAGTIDVRDQNVFQKLVFRTSRGKVLCYFANTPCQLR